MWNVLTLYQSGCLALLLQTMITSWTSWASKEQMDRKWPNDQRRIILYAGHEEQYESGIGYVLNKRSMKALIGWKPSMN